MINQDVIDLYKRIAVRAKVVVASAVRPVTGLAPTGEKHGRRSGV
jgi:hypothetical protein